MPPCTNIQHTAHSTQSFIHLPDYSVLIKLCAMSAAALWLAAIVLSRLKTLSSLNLRRHGDECLQFTLSRLPRSATAVNVVFDSPYLNLATIWLSQDNTDTGSEARELSWICCEYQTHCTHIPRCVLIGSDSVFVTRISILVEPHVDAVVTWCRQRYPTARYYCSFPSSSLAQRLSSSTYRHNDLSRWHRELVSHE